MIANTKRVRIYASSFNFDVANTQITSNGLDTLMWEAVGDDEVTAVME